MREYEQRKKEKKEKTHNENQRENYECVVFYCDYQCHVECESTMRVCMYLFSLADM